MNPEAEKQTHENLPQTPWINETSNTTSEYLSEVIDQEESLYKWVDGSCKFLDKEPWSNVSHRKFVNENWGYIPECERHDWD